MTATCRLAVIFAANLAGSWRPLGADEKSTFAEAQDDPIEADPRIAGGDWRRSNKANQRVRLLGNAGHPGVAYDWDAPGAKKPINRCYRLIFRALHIS